MPCRSHLGHHLEDVPLRVIRARAGLPTPIIWSLSLLSCATVLWLPDGVLSMPLKVTLSILSLTVVFSVASTLPYSRILFAIDDCMFISTAMQLRTKEVALIRLTEHGRTAGVYADLFSPHESFPKLEVQMNILKDKHDFEETLAYAFPTATIKCERSLWGSPLDYLVGVLAAACLTGLLKLIVGSI